MSHPIHIQQRPVLCAVFSLALASAVTATSAQAAIIEAGGSVVLNGTTTASTMDSSSTDSVTESGFGDTADFTTTGSYRTTVDQNGSFLAATSGSINNFGSAPVNNYETQAYVQFSDTLTNSTAVAQEQLVTINLAAGGAQVNQFDAFGGSDSLETELMLDLSFGANNVYSSGFRLENVGGTISRTQLGGDTFAGVSSFAFGLEIFEWDAQVITVALGVLNPGASSNFTYRYNSSSFGSISNGFCDVGEGSLCGSRNSFGDPVSFAFSTRAIGGPVNPVPEPTTGALLGLGLFALIGSRRRLRNAL